MGRILRDRQRFVAPAARSTGFGVVAMAIAMACSATGPGAIPSSGPTALTGSGESLSTGPPMPSGSPIPSGGCGHFEDCSIVKADIPMPQGWEASDGGAYADSTSLNAEEAITLASAAGTSLVDSDPYVRFLWVAPQRPDPGETAGPRWVTLSTVPAPPFFDPYDPTGERTPLVTGTNHGYVMLDPQGEIVFSGIATYFPLDDVPTLPPR